MARALQPVSVAGIEFDALIGDELTLEATIPQYAVESGFSVSDTIIKESESLSMSLFVTDTPVTWAERHGVVPGRAEQVCNQLRELYYTGEPVEVITSEKTYENMAISSITITKSLEIGYAREVSITFQLLRTTTSEVTTIPDSYGKSGKTGKSAGAASTSKGTETGAGSSGGSGGGSETSRNPTLLYGVLSGVGVIK